MTRNRDLRAPDKGADRHRLNSFFAGIGGFELAFGRHGFATAFYCEKDRFCRRVLERHWPATPNAGDIRELKAATIPVADVWTAGFPCQDLSLAKVPHGRSGFRGDHSSVFFTFHELLSAHKPNVVILENVAGLLNSHGGADFQALLTAMTDLGYAVAWRVLNARHFGVPQSRPRVFICAWMEDPVRAVRALYEDGAAPQAKWERLGFITPSEYDNSGAMVPQTSYCVSATSGRHTGLDWARSYVTYDFGVRRLTPLECERLQGFPDTWSIPNLVAVESAGSYDTERYRAIGNAVAIPVVEWVAQRVQMCLEDLRSRPDLAQQHTATDGVLLNKLAEEFDSPATKKLELAHAQGAKWQRGGCAFHGSVVHAPVSTRPITTVESTMGDIIEKVRVDERYFLSPNAARGIISRVERRGRHLFAPLDASLRRLVKRNSESHDGPRAARTISASGAVA